MIDIVVHRVSSFRVDPHVLRRPGRRFVLISTEGKHDYMTSTGYREAFDEVCVLHDDFDEVTLTEAVRDLIEGAPADQVSLLCHDEYALRDVAAVRSALGLAGAKPQDVAAFTDKAKMKQHLVSAGVRVPRYAVFDPTAYLEDQDAYLDSLERQVGLPAFVKPTGESGSVGVAELNSRHDLDLWAARAASQDVTGNTDAYEVDEFIDGTLYHVDSLVEDGRVISVRCNRYLHPLADYANGQVCSSYTLDENEGVHARLVAFNEAVLEAYPDKPANGAFHHEVFEREDGELIFLEIAARAPAALAPHTGKLRWGVDIEEAHFRLQQGEPVTIPPEPGPYAGFIYYPKLDGTVAELTEPAVGSSSHVWMPNVCPGDAMTRSSDVRDFAAAVLVWNEDYEALLADLDQLARHQPLRAA